MRAIGKQLEEEKEVIREEGIAECKADEKGVRIRRAKYGPWPFENSAASAPVTPLTVSISSFLSFLPPLGLPHKMLSVGFTKALNDMVPGHLVHCSVPWGKASRGLGRLVQGRKVVSLFYARPSHE